MRWAIGLFLFEAQAALGGLGKQCFLALGDGGRPLKPRRQNSRAGLFSLDSHEKEARQESG
jgi:hypothetical protein